MASLKTFHNTYLCFEQNTGRILADRLQARAWERVKAIPDPADPTHGWIEDGYGHNLLTDDNGNATFGHTDDQSRKYFGLWQRERDGQLLLSIQSTKTGRWLRAGSHEEGYWVHFAREGEPAEYETFVVEGIGAGAHPSPLRGYLQSSGRGWLHDGGQPCAPIGLMCGDGLLAQSEGKDVYTGILVPAARAGFQFTMPWSPLIWRRGQGGRFWGDRSFSPLSVPNFWDHVREWVQWSKQLELKVFLAHGGLAGATNAEEDAYVHGLIDLMAQEGPEHFIFPMMGNEIRDTGDRDDLDPREHARLIRQIHDRFPQVPYLIGSWTGDPAREDVDRITRALKTFAPESNHGCFHGHRHGDFAQKIRRCWNYPFETYKGIADCWVNDESVGPQGRNGHLSEMHNAHEMDHHFMHAFTAISVLARTCVGFTCSPSVIFDEPFEDIPGFTTAVGFAREIPAEASTYAHPLHSGPRDGSRRVFEAEGDIRVDGRIDDAGNFAFLAYGQDVAHIGSGLKLAQSAEFDLVTTDREVHHFRLARGQRIPRVPVTKGYLLRGRQG